MPKSEIRVQLTPEGLQQVLDAFRQVQTEARTSARNTSVGVDGLRRSFISLRTVLGSLGIITTVAGLVQLGRSSVSTAKNIVDSAKQVGTSARDYSRLQEAIRATKGDVDALDPAITKLRSNLSKALSDPNSEAAAAFKRLRIDAEAFAKLSLEQQLALIANKVAALASEEDKLRAVTDLLGRGSDGLVASFRNGGDEFIRAADNAERLGLVLQNDVATRVDRAGEAVDRLKAKLRSATQTALAFVSTLLIPESKVEAITRVVERLQDFRRTLLANTFGGLVRTDATDRALAAIDAKIEALLKKQRELQGFEPPGVETAAAGDETLATVETSEQRRARLALERQRIQDEIALQAERNKLRRESDQAAYDQGIISLEEYYARRLALTRAASEAEIAALQAQLRLVQSAPAEDDDERRRLGAEADKLRHEIALRRLRTETEINALAAEETTEQRRLDEQWSQTLVRLDELEGRRHEAFLRNLEEEIRQIEQLGRQAGQAAADIQQQVNRFRTASTARETFRVADEDFESELDAFDRDARRIQLEQEAGLLTQLEGENRLIALQRERLAVLQQSAQAALVAAQATGDPALIAQAQQQAASVAQIAASFDAATNSAARLRQGLESGIQQGFVDLFTNIDKIRSLEDAFRSLAITVARSLAQIAAEILAKQATFALLRAFGSAFGGGAAGAGAPAGRLGGEVEGYAGGGKVRGRRLPIRGPDKVPALLQDGEHVIRRAAAMQPGARDFLQRFNTGRLSMADIRAAMDMAPSLPRFAEGGPVNLAATEIDGAGGRRAGLAGVLGLEDGLVFRHLDAPAFEELLVKKIARNPSMFRSALGL